MRARHRLAFPLPFALRLARPVALAVAFLLLFPVAPGAHADETGATPPPPEASGPLPQPAPLPVSGPKLTADVLDLLPLNEFERQDFRAANRPLSQRIEGLVGRRKDLEARLQKRTGKGTGKDTGKGTGKGTGKNTAKGDEKGDEEGKKLAAQLDGVNGALGVSLGELREALRPHGLTDELLVQMAAAPRGEGRIERHARRLVLLVPDLSPVQRKTFERVVAAVEGAWLSSRALATRTELLLKQSGLEGAGALQVLQGFRRQSAETDRRFWRLVDYLLTDDQKVALWELLPTPLRQHDTPVDHVYELPGITPAQSARIKALLTEVEAESAPDQALVKRLRMTLAGKDVSREDRAARQKELGEAYARLGALRRRADDLSKEILGSDLVRALKAIPPRVSINDRREDGRRLREGMALTREQEARIAALQGEAARAAKRYRERLQQIRREVPDAGAESPEQMMMEMMTAGARGEALAAQRELIGRVFLEVLEADQLDGWLAGLYGTRR